MENDAEARLTAGEMESWLSYKIRLVQILAYRAFEARMSASGRAPRYLGLLSIIEAHPGQPQSRLAEAVALRRSSLVTILDQLQADGIVERRPSESDRRTNGVWLTRAGLKAVQSLREEAARHESKLREGLSNEELEIVSNALDRLVGNLSRSE
jgi:DNA-binding MarR family transcriptional regulator